MHVSSSWIDTLAKQSGNGLCVHVAREIRGEGRCASLPHVMPDEAVPVGDAILIAVDAVRLAGTWRLIIERARPPWPFGMAMCRAWPQRALIRDEAALCCTTHCCFTHMPCSVAKLLESLPVRR